MTEPLAQLVVSVIAAEQKLPIGEITLDSSFRELGIDSFAAVCIILALESEFNITIPHGQEASLRTVRDAVQAVEHLLPAPPPPLKPPQPG
jgi:acyl carrier protein